MVTNTRYHHIMTLRIASILAIFFMVTYMLIIGKTIFQPLVVALLLFFFINTLANFFKRINIKGRHLPTSIATALAIIIIFSLMLLIVFFGISVSVAEVSKKWNDYKTVLVDMISRLDDWSAFQIQNATGKEFDLGAGPVIQSIQNFNIDSIIDKTKQAVGNVFVFLGIMILYLIFLLIEQQVFPNKMKALFPNNEDHSDVEEILGRIGDSVFTYIKVKTLISAATGLCTYATLLLFKVESAAFWGILTFVLNFIPNVGSLASVFLICLATFAQFESPSRVLFLFVILTIIQQFFGAFVDPRMSGNRLNLSPLVIIMSLVFWGKIWGILGAFFCVPLTVIIFIILSNFEPTRPIAILLSSKGIVEEPKRKYRKLAKKQLTK